MKLASRWRPLSGHQIRREEGSGMKSDRCQSASKQRVISRVSRGRVVTTA